MQRIEHVKVRNYIENIVHNYDNIDFIMHFRLSRNVAYNLIDQFRVSEIYTSLQGIIEFYCVVYILIRKNIYTRYI